VVHRLISPLILWLRPPLVSVTNGLTGSTPHSSR
jgi:hypothetical protein